MPKELDPNKIVVNGEEVEFSPKDALKAVIAKAREVHGDAKLRIYLSDLRKTLIDVLNEYRYNRITYIMKQYPHLQSRTNAGDLYNPPTNHSKLVDELSRIMNNNPTKDVLDGIKRLEVKYSLL